MSRLVVLALRITRSRERMFGSPERLRAAIAADRERGPALPSRGMRRRLDVEEREVAGARVFRVRPRGRGTDVAVVYFHGGAFVLDALLVYQWRMVERLVRASGATVHVPLYPLAPEHSHEAIAACARAVWDDVASTARASYVLGDSSGGTMALRLIQALRDEGRPQPRRAILLAPWVDARVEDPLARALAPRDPMLAIPGMQEAARLHARDTPLTDPRVSPVLGSLAGVCPLTVFVGTRDLLLGDARRLAALAAAQGVALEHLEAEGMMHVWPLLVALPEARAAIARMAATLDPAYAPGTAPPRPAPRVSARAGSAC